MTANEFTNYCLGQCHATVQTECPELEGQAYQAKVLDAMIQLFSQLNGRAEDCLVADLDA